MAETTYGEMFGGARYGNVEPQVKATEQHKKDHPLYAYDCERGVMAQVVDLRIEIHHLGEMGICCLVVNGRGIEEGECGFIKIVANNLALALNFTGRVSEYKEVEVSPNDSSDRRKQWLKVYYHKFVDRHSPADNSCAFCGLHSSEVIHSLD